MQKCFKTLAWRLFFFPLSLLNVTGLWQYIKLDDNMEQLVIKMMDGFYFRDTPSSAIMHFHIKPGQVPIHWRVGLFS